MFGAKMLSLMVQAGLFWHLHWFIFIYMPILELSFEKLLWHSEMTPSSRGNTSMDVVLHPHYIAFNGRFPPIHGSQVP